MLTSNTVGTGSRPTISTSTSDGSLTLNIVEGQSLDGKAELDEANPVISTSDADDYPDGGLAAWCVVVGVSSFPFPEFLDFTNVGSCSLRVPSSQRRFHPSGLALNRQLTSNSHRIGLVNTWGVRPFQTLLLAGPRLTAGIGIPGLL